jgi:hypothetical protein
MDDADLEDTLAKRIFDDMENAHDLAGDLKTFLKDPTDISNWLDAIKDYHETNP